MRITPLLLILIISCDMKKTNLIEPQAKKIEKILSIHGDDRIDEYYWLNQRGNDDVINYLNEENDYRNEYMKDYKPLEEKIFKELKKTIVQYLIFIMIISTILDMKKISSIQFTVEKKILLITRKKYLLMLM